MFSKKSIRAIYSGEIKTQIDGVQQMKAEYLNIDSENRPHRIALIVGKIVFGGVDIVAMNWLRCINREEFQLDFFVDGLDSTPIDTEITTLGGRIYKLPSYERNLAENLREFRKILRNNKYSIVHCCMNSLSVFWLREAKKCNIPIRISHNRSTASISEGVRVLIKYALRPFSRVYPTHYLACSEYAGQWLFGRNATKKGKVTVLYNALEINKFNYNTDVRTKVREHMGITDNFVIGHIGRFMAQKNHTFLIDVFQNIHSVRSNAKLVLVGDGLLFDSIKSLVQSKGLENSVIYCGRRNDVSEIMQAMDYFMFPSIFEGLGNAVIEAQAAGLPCLVSDRVPNEAVILDSCLQIPLSSPKVWAEIILRQTEVTRERRGSVPEIEKYDCILATKALEHFYNACLNVGE
jgi:glycosyltransferase involved in cell wall biosynthesis